MSKKAATVFVCQECGFDSPKWMGQCICGAWNTMVEEKILPLDKKKMTAGGIAPERSHPVIISKVKSGDKDRIDTGIGELNRVLGGGLVRGSLTLISGEPGIGKSTLIIQAAAQNCSSAGHCAVCDRRGIRGAN